MEDEMQRAGSFATTGDNVPVANAHRRQRRVFMTPFLAAGLCLAAAAMPALAQTAWQLPVDGGWSTAASWTGGVPTGSLDATINVTGSPYIVTQSGGTIAARTLLLDSADARLTLSSATLNLSSTATSLLSQGTVALSSSTINGRFSIGSGATILQTAGPSHLRLEANNGLVRVTGGSISFGGFGAALGWSNGAGAVIEADGSTATTFFVSGGGERWTNAGELVSRNGAQFNVGGRTTTAAMGTLRLFDTARMNLNGTIDNTAANLTAPLGGSFDATGGTVIGGTIAPGTFVLRNRIGSGVVGLRLEGGAIWEGDVTILSNSLRVYPGSTFTGTQLNASGSFGVTFVGPATISGKTITLTTISANKTTFTVGTDLGAAQTVTLAADSELRGTGFRINCDVNNCTLVNQGTIRSLSGATDTSAVGTLHNQGSIVVESGTFTLGAFPLINDGIFEARAGTTLLLATSGFTQGATGEMRGAGQINLGAAITGGTLRPGENGIGTLTVQAPFSEPARFTGPTTFAIEIGGSNADRLFFNNGSRGVDLGTNMVTLSIALLSPPTAETYRIVNLTTGFQNLLSGAFTGLPHGSTVIANHAGTDYTFTVEYDTKGVTLRLPPMVTPVALTGVASSKPHGVAGSFEIPVNVLAAIGGPVTVEPRALGNGHVIIFRFDGTVATVGAVAAVDSAGDPVTTGAPVISGNAVIVTLPSVADGKRVKVTLAGVNGSLNTEASIGFLLGDVDGSRLLDATDASAVKARAGQATDAGNFRFDLNATGVVSAADVAGVKARAGRDLP